MKDKKWRSWTYKLLYKFEFSIFSYDFKDLEQEAHYIYLKVNMILESDLKEFPEVEQNKILFSYYRKTLIRHLLRLREQNSDKHISFSNEDIQAFFENRTCFNLGSFLLDLDSVSSDIGKLLKFILTSTEEELETLKDANNGTWFNWKVLRKQLNIPVKLKTLKNLKLFLQKV